jgi:transcription antitermination factor NusG
MVNSSVECEHQVSCIEVTPTDSAKPGRDAILASGSNWYALYTRHQHERVVAHHLERIGLEVFLPLYREVHQWKDRRKSVVLPLFPCYVLFSGDLSRRIEILNTPGVFSLVGSGAKVGVIPAAELDAVRTAVMSPLPLEPHPFMQCGERIRVRYGPLAGIEGIVARKKNSLRIVLSIEMLSRSVSVEVEEAHVERIACS